MACWQRSRDDLQESASDGLICNNRVMQKMSHTNIRFELDSKLILTQQYELDQKAS